MKKIYNEWYKHAPEEIKKQMKKMTPSQIKDRFSKELNFGTAGLRGIIKFGSAYINEYVIARASLAYGQYLIQKYGKRAKQYGVVITHDNRRFKILYSETAAKVLSALGIKVSFFPKNKLQSTPLLSYTIAKGKFVGGMNITASHNPPVYNGFKIYNEDGKQLDVVDTNIIQETIKTITNVFDIEMNTKKIRYLHQKTIDGYINEILEYIPFKRYGDFSNLKIIFTPQHGTATEIGKKLLKDLKVRYRLVKEQVKVDSEFSNTKSPNPMYEKAFELAKKYGDKFKADILFSTDPDADRFGVMAKHNDKWIMLNGNQLPTIQIAWKLKKLKEMDYIQKGDFIVRSVVTSNFADKIAKKYGVKVYETFTGFKNIINLVLKQEAKGYESLFAWEESMGSTIRSFTRDKDAFQALVQVIEMASEYKKEGKTLVDAYNELEDKYGYHSSAQKPIKITGSNAMTKMNNIIAKYKKIKVGNKIAGLTVTKVKDYSKGYKNFSKDNFVTIVMGENSLTVRPSGTEPILRIYVYGFGSSKREADTNLNNLLKSI